MEESSSNLQLNGASFSTNNNHLVSLSQDRAIFPRIKDARMIQQEIVGTATERSLLNIKGSNLRKEIFSPVSSIQQLAQSQIN